MGLLRVLLAGCLVWLVLMVGVGLATYFKLPVWAATALTLTLGGGGVIAALLLSGGRNALRMRGRPVEEVLADLEQKGLLVSSSFEAKRAFAVEETEDEGLHYYLELANQQVLFLSGQYLYDYEPIDDDPEVDQKRTFPCTTFTVHRHRTEHYVVQIECAGDVLEPESTFRGFSGADYKAGAIPADGDLLKLGYEELKLQRSEAG